MTNRFVLFILVFFCTASLVKAQYNDDFRIRTGIELNKDFRKGFQLGFQYQYRRNNNLTEFQGSYFTISPSYKINDYLNTTIDLRYATSLVWDRFRIASYLNTHAKYRKVEYSMRAGYLYEYYLQEFSEIGQFLPTHNIRLRFQLEKKVIKKVKAQVGIEPVWRQEDHGFQFRQFRNTASLNWEYMKNHKVSLEYLWQPSYSSEYLYSNHTILFNYSIYIPKIKKKSVNSDK